MTAIVLRPEDEARLRAGWAEWLNSRKGRLRPRTFEQWVADFIHDYAATFPEAPKAAPARRSLSQVERQRYQERTANGEPTEAIAVVYGVPPERVRRLRDTPTEQLQTIRTARPPEESR